MDDKIKVEIIGEKGRKMMKSIGIGEEKKGIMEIIGNIVDEKREKKVWLEEESDDIDKIEGMRKKKVKIKKMKIGVERSIEKKNKIVGIGIVIKKKSVEEDGKVMKEIIEIENKSGKGGKEINVDCEGIVKRGKNSIEEEKIKSEVSIKVIERRRSNEE